MTTPAPKPELKTSLKEIVKRLALLVLLIGMTILLIINKDRVQELQAYGYPGIFLVSALANATIIFPVPGIMFTSAMGAVFNPFWVALAAGSGAAVGELSGYLAGYSGQLFIERSRYYQRVRMWMEKYGTWTLLVLAFIPNPLFDIAGFIAGSMKIPVWKFFVLCLVGKLLKMLLFAYLGASLFFAFM